MNRNAIEYVFLKFTQKAAVRFTLLLIKSNLFSFLAVIHKFTKNKYQKRFPELDSLIVGEMEYLHAVKELGNDLDQVKNNEKLQQILTQATIMIVSVTASTTQG